LYRSHSVLSLAIHRHRISCYALFTFDAGLGARPPTVKSPTGHHQGWGGGAFDCAFHSTRPPTGTPRRAISPGEGLPILFTSR
jgi:hypothetical protein